MAELLVRAKGHWKDSFTQVQIDALSIKDKEQFDARSQIGDIIVVRPDGWEWGNKECLPDYIVIKIPSLSVEEAKKFEEVLMKKVVEKIKIVVPASRWEATYGIGVIPSDEGQEFVEIPQVLNTIHGVGGITGYEVEGQGYVRKMAKRRKHQIPSAFMANAIAQGGV